MTQFLKSVVALLLLQVLWGCEESADIAGTAASKDDALVTITANQAEAIFDYAYPLVIMKISQDMMFTVPFRPNSRPNQLILFKRLAMPQNRAVVLGNRNTLYSVGWVDVSKGPVIFEIPDMGERYYVMPLLDAWTNTFRSLGSRTTGQRQQKYLLVGPSWRGDVPEEYQGHEVIVCPTNMVWITGRIQADDPQDAVVAGFLQDAYELSTLQEATGGLDPFEKFKPTYLAKNVRKPVPYSLAMSPADFYNEFFRMWRQNPSAAEDGPMLEVLAKAGIAPGRELTFESLSEESQALLAEGLRKKQASYLSAFYEGEEQNSPWIFNRERMGTWGIDYARRAYWAMWGLGANLVEDAVYGVSQLDSQLQALDGSALYRLHFDADGIPPTSAFWSVTSYDEEGYLEANEEQRYSLGSHHELTYNADGSLDFYLSNKSPADESSNWVPAPKGRFKVLLRIYWPDDEVLNGQWQIPPLEKIEAVSPGWR